MPKEVGHEVKSCIKISVLSLCRTLQEYYGKKVYLLVDEFDTSFIAANEGVYYEAVRGRFPKC